MTIADAGLPPARAEALPAPSTIWSPCSLCPRPAEPGHGLWTDDLFYYALCSKCGLSPKTSRTQLEIDALAFTCIMQCRSACASGEWGAPISSYRLGSFVQIRMPESGIVGVAPAKAKAPDPKKAESAVRRPKMSRLAGRIFARAGACRACVFGGRVTGTRPTGCWACGTPDGLIFKLWKRKQLRAMRKERAR